MISDFLRFSIGNSSELMVVSEGGIGNSEFEVHLSVDWERRWMGGMKLFNDWFWEGRIRWRWRNWKLEAIAGLQLCVATSQEQTRG